MSESGVPATRPNPIRAWIDRLTKAEQFFLNLLLASMAILVAAQVLSRYVTALPAFWLEEMARLTLVWLTFFGASIAIAKGINLVVTFLSDRLGKAYTRSAKIVGALIELACFTVLITGSWELVARFGTVLSSASGLPRSLLFIAPLIGFALAAVHSIVNLVDELRGRADDETRLEELSI